MTSSSEKKTACLVCRQRKVACDRRRPRCGLCEKNDFDCRYKARDHRPGLRAGYVTQLEKRLEQLENRMNHVEGQAFHQTPLNNSHTSETPNFPEAEGVGFSRDIQRDHGLSSSPRPPSSMARDAPGWLSPANIPSAHSPPSNQFQDLWLENYHWWFPILHTSSVERAFLEVEPEYILIQKAIIAVTVYDIPTMSWEQKNTQSAALRHDVIISAMASANICCAQALLILGILYWGEGDWPQYVNISAVCKRISQQLGLDALAGVVKAPSIKICDDPDKIFACTKEIDTEERIRTYWMAEMMESILILEMKGRYSSEPVPNSAKLPGSELAWQLPVSGQRTDVLQNPEYHSALSMCIRLCTTELPVIHQFQQSTLETDIATGESEWQSAAQRLDERLTIWREEFVADVFRLINNESPEDPQAEMQPFIVLTNCVLNMAVISLLQAKTSLPDSIGGDAESWPYANHRCIYACENMAAKVRRIKNNELKHYNPCLVLPVFVAARFYIIHTKFLLADVSINLHSLAYALYLYRHRWTLAEMFELVIRTAVAEHRTPVANSQLPAEFYDLRKTAIEISPALWKWARSFSPPVLRDQGAS